MQASDPAGAGARDSRIGIGSWAAPIEATMGALEVTASEQPELLEFVAHVLRNSTMSFAVQELAGSFGVAPGQVGDAVLRGCTDLDRLEKHRGRWRDPAQVLASPNLAVLCYACHARLNRVRPLPRRRKLERIQRQIERAVAHARSRAWLESFIGPLPERRKDTRDGNR